MLLLRQYRVRYQNVVVLYSSIRGAAEIAAEYLGVQVEQRVYVVPDMLGRTPEVWLTDDEVGLIARSVTRPD